MKVSQNDRKIEFKFSKGELTQQVLKEKIEGLRLLFGENTKIYITGQMFMTPHYDGDFWANYRTSFSIKKVNQKWIDIESAQIEGDIYTKIALYDNSDRYTIWVEI
jgi:hypothetical protein